MANVRTLLKSKWLSGVLLLSIAIPAWAIQTITGPAGSEQFGRSVALLPNGNIVVADPAWTDGTTDELGAVYLYKPNGQLISTLTGSTANDNVGMQIVVLTNGNFVVCSPNWNASGTSTYAGAVTWVNGTTGLSGKVSSSNSLVGGSTGDSLCENSGVIALPGGNYIVLSELWANGATKYAGAITWGSGTTGVKGAVSATNSLVGTHQGDDVGSGDETNDHPRVTVLSNGNVVVTSLHWANGSATDAGAATWISASTGNHGAISSANSLVGSQAGDLVGYGDVVALTNGNYVVSSPYWANGTTAAAGAATWGNGASGTVGTVSASNSLVGTRANDLVSVPGTNLSLGVTALTNGNYVVSSRSWSNGSNSTIGAATWANGTTGLPVGPVTTSNSLYGVDVGDQIGYDVSVTALSNGNYVVAGPGWNNSRGAVTWGNGVTGIVGAAAGGNSIVGSIPYSGPPSVDGDRVGWTVTALTNGNYVIGSQFWNNDAGAATCLNGSGVASGTVSASNSIVGSSGDQVSSRGIVALTNGNYVIDSDQWNDDRGAATWASGAAASVGTVSAANSLVGSTSGDRVGRVDAFGQTSIVALANGNYVVGSQYWTGTANQSGAATWASGTNGVTGTVSSANSLVGSSEEDWIGSGGIIPQSNGNYIVLSPNWNNGALSGAGAITEGHATGGTVGPLTSANSVLGTVASNGGYQSYDYDATHDLLVVGQPLGNRVVFFSPDEIFKDGFE